MIDRIELEIIEASDMVAKVSVRPIFHASQTSNLRVTGNIRGPFCKKANTLPADFPITDDHDAPHPRGAASIVDPCYWTPELPMMYEVSVRVMDGESIVGDDRTTVGIRRPTPRDFSEL